MNRTFKVSLLCAGIFGCGVVAGALGGRKFVHASHPPGPPPPSNQPEGFGPQQLRRFSAELGLTEEQQRAILPLLEHAGEELRQLRRESFRQSSAIIEAMEVAVSEQLTPEQKEKLAVLQEAQRARIRAKMEERNRRRAEGEGQPRREGEDGDLPPGPPPPPPDL
jgi:Spy/CpxP family protein refolding chaperone